MGARACSHSVHVLPRLPDGEEEEEGRRQGARGAHACCWKGGKGSRARRECVRDRRRREGKGANPTERCEDSPLQAPE